MVDSLKNKYLLFKARHGSGEAIASIFDRYFQKIYRFVYFRLQSREDAEDVASDVFLQFQAHLQKGGDVKNLSGLLYQIARNKIADFYRARKIENIPLQDLETNEERIKELGALLGTEESSKVDTAADFALVMKGLETLKPEYREVILLHYINEMTVRELALALEKKENNIRVMLFRALGALREAVLTQSIESNDQQKFNKNLKESNTA